MARVKSIRIPNIELHLIRTFQRICGAKGLTMSKALRQLMERVTEGEIALIDKDQGG